MRVNPVSLPTIPEVSERTASPHVAIELPTQSHPVMPTMEAARLERQIRAMPNVVPQARPPIMEQTTKCLKNSCYVASMVCGIAVLPSFACLSFGTIGLVAPAALFVGFVAFSIIGGKPTSSIEASIDRLHNSNQSTHNIGP